MVGIKITIDILSHQHKHQGGTVQEAPFVESGVSSPTADEIRKLAKKVEEEKQAAEEILRQAKDILWNALSADDQESFREKVTAEMSLGFKWPSVAITAVAKTFAWENRSGMHTTGLPSQQ